MTPQYNPNRMESISGKFLDVLILSIWLMSPAPLSNTPMYWNQPYLPFFLPSLLPPAEDDKMWDFAITHNYWVKISYAAFNTFYSIAVGQLFLVAAVFPSLYTLTILPLVKNEFRLNHGNSKYKWNTYKVLRSVTYLPKEYNNVQLMHKQINRSITYVVMVMHWEFLQIILSLNFILLKNWNSLDIFSKIQLVIMSVMCMMAWTCGLEIIGRFHQMSITTLRSWENLMFRRVEEKKYFKKYAKTCQPLVVGLRGVFTIKRLTVLKFTRAVVKGTFKAVLTIGRR
ncbi:uncharacterized protein LOC118435610 [Folsomia candida]|nr:uncharacterized protein LOC118435610 [Folsomia candida]